MTALSYSDIYLGLAKIVQTLDPSIKVILKGMPLPSLEGDDEFVAFDLLSEVEKASRNYDGDRVFTVQLACYCLHAEFRSDKSFTAPYRLADKYKTLLHRANHTIKTSCLRTLDTRIVYLDLHASGDYSKQSYQKNSSLMLHSCVLYTTAHIS